MKAFKLFIAVLLVFSFNLYSNDVGTAIDNGIQWLKDSQNAEGSWGNDTTVSIYVSTATVCEALGTVNPSDSAYLKGITYLDSLESKNSIYLSQKIKALAPSDIDISSLQDTLLTYYSPPIGGFTFDKEERDVLSTAFALISLHESGYPVNENIGWSIGYLMDTQDTAGFWRYNDENTSNLYLTALCVISLEYYQTYFILSQQINNGATWLTEQQNTNGSFGEDTTSVYETALSLTALINTKGSSLEESIKYSESSNKARDFLLAKQDTAGSWNDNEYETALAILALSTMSPNLIVSSASTIPSSPVEGEEFTLSAIIKNIGTEKADLFEIKFMLDTLVLWEGVIDSLLPGDSLIVDFSYNLPSGRYEVKGIVDYNDSIKEGNERDNEYSYHLNVFTRLDLVVYPQDIKIEPVIPEETDTIRVEFSVYNAGETSVSNATAAVYDGDPQNEGLLLVTFDFPFIGGGQYVSGAFLTMLPQGNHTLYVVADPDDIILESNETNNTATRSFNVTGLPPDLAINNNDITYTPASPEEGDSVTILANIHNIGEGSATSIMVGVYEGNPNAGGIQIGSAFINFILSGRTQTIDIDWQTVGKEGNNDMWVVIDPDNEIEETGKLNNIANKIIQVNPSDIICPERAVLGDSVDISAWVHNRGGEPVEEDVIVYMYTQESESVCEDVFCHGTVPGLGAKDSFLLVGTWYIDEEKYFNYPYLGKSETIYVKGDMPDFIDEKDEDNNLGSKDIIITLTDIAELTLDSLDISFNPSEPEVGEQTIITAEIHNLFDLDAENVKVDFYNGGLPGEGGILIVSTTIPSIGANSSAIAEVNWTTENKGLNTIGVVIDPDNTIAEANENNNTASRYIWVGDKFPVLSWSNDFGFINAGVNPYSGDTNDVFEYRIVYSDPDNDAPAEGYPRVWIDINGNDVYSDVVGGFAEGMFAMTPLDDTDSNYVDGRTYIYSATLPRTATAMYRFDAKDINDNPAIKDKGPISRNNGPVVGNFPPSVNIMPEYPTWPGREMIVWGNVHDPNWGSRQFTVAADYDMTEEEGHWEVDFGTNTGLSGDDEYTVVTLPFEFEFYDSTFNEIYISTNGFVGFSPENDYTKKTASDSFPNEQDKYIIAPFWADFELIEDPYEEIELAAVYYLENSEGTFHFWPSHRFVITWSNVSPKDNPEEKYTFQLILFKEGNIRFNYEKIDTTVEAAVGVNLGDGIEGRTYEDKPVSKRALSLLDREYEKEIVDSHWEMDFGTNTGLTGDDDYTTVSLPFPVELYDATFNEIHISTNGYVGFSDENDYTLNSCDSFPSNSFKYVLAPYLEDLYFEEDGRVYCLETKVSDGNDWTNSWDVFIITWLNAHLKNHPENTYSFQLILTENNKIMYSYDNIEVNHLDSPAVGMNKGDGIEGTFYPAHPTSKKSIQFKKGINQSIYKKALVWEDDYGIGSGLYGDTDYTTHQLDFLFHFYDRDFDSLFISTNGWADFWATNNQEWYHHARWPSKGDSFPISRPDYAICPYGYDLYVFQDRPVRINDIEDEYGKRCVITWDSVRCEYSSSINTFQMIIKETGDIFFNYKLVGEVGEYILPKVGINKGDEVQGISLEALPKSGETFGFILNNETYGYIEKDFRWIAYGDYIVLDNYWTNNKTWVKLGMPFTFDIYDRSYNSLTVMTNGLFYFNGIRDQEWYEAQSTFPNPNLCHGGYTCLPVYAIGNQPLVIHVKGGGLYKFSKAEGGDTCFVTTTAYATNGQNTSPKERDIFTFQTVFYPSGEIMMNYKEVKIYSSIQSFFVGLNYGDGRIYTRGIGGETYEGLSILYKPIRYPMRKTPYTLDGDYGTWTGLRAWTTSGSNSSKIIDLPFEFQFYDTLVNKVNVAARGHIDIGEYNGYYWINDQAKYAIAPLWYRYDDRYSNGRVYYKVDEKSFPRKAIFTFFDYSGRKNIDANTFQAILYENGDIRFNYNAIGSKTGVPIGILKDTSNLTLYNSYPTPGTSLHFEGPHHYFPDTLFYSIDFGDGSPPAEEIVQNPKFIMEKHTYTGMWKDYNAVLTVRDEHDAVDSDTALIHVIPKDRAKVNAAIEDGLRYLYTIQSEDGMWHNFNGRDFDIGCTSMPLLAFANNGYTSAGNFDKDIYAEYLKMAEEELLKNTTYNHLSVQDAGNPDTDGNSKGVSFYTKGVLHPETGDINEKIGYESPMAMMAIIASCDPDSNFGRRLIPLGRWVELKVPAVDIEMEGEYLQGISFDIYGGKVFWDRSVIVFPDGSEYVCVDDTIPAGATAYGTWDWVTDTVYSGIKAHRSAAPSSITRDEHYYSSPSQQIFIEPGSYFSTWVWIDPVNTPEQVMLRFRAYNWDHRAYWGADKSQEWKQIFLGSYGDTAATFRDLIVDAVDFLSWAQNESKYGRGGWRYYPNTRSSDNSVTQWPSLALHAAENEWGIYAPDWVKDELMKWIAMSQKSNGGFTYIDTLRTTTDYETLTRTAAGLCELSYCGVSSEDTSRFQKALNFINDNWYNKGENYVAAKNFGFLYGMYGVMKGCRTADPPIEYIGEHNWYEEYVDSLLSCQRGDGSYPMGIYKYDALATSWSILILTPYVIGEPPVADAGPDQIVAPGDIVHFNGSSSYHQDTSRTIVEYEWDFNDDGIYDSTGVTSVYMWPDTGKYYVTLKIYDDNTPPRTDIDVCIINVTLENHPPVANAGGPYEGFVNSSIFLDGSASYDPDTLEGDSIVFYGWDIDGDGEFDDLLEKSGQWTWDEPFTGKIGLKVEDIEGMSDIEWTDVDIVYFSISSEGANPDPFSPGMSPGIKDITNISYTLSGNSDIEIYILNNLTGDTITVLGPFDRIEGSNQESWDGSSYSSGIYPYIVWSNKGFSVTDTVEIDNIPPTGIILQPSEWDTVTTGTPNLTIIGTATDANWEGSAANFDHFTLEYGEGENPTSWDLISEGVIFIVEGILGSIDIAALPSGVSTLRLKTYDKAGNEFVTYRRITTVSAPDLLITSLTPFPQSAMEGDTILLTADVINQSSLPSGENRIKFFLGIPENGELINETSVPALNAGENTSIEIRWSSKGYPGINPIWAWVDAEDIVEESNENNNRLMTTVEISVPTLPDLTITDILFQPGDPMEGDIVNITGLTHNTGASVSNFRVNFSSDGSLIGSEIINDTLKTGETMPVELEWDTYGWFGTHDIELYADPDNLIEELSEDNNTMSKAISIGPSPIVLSVTADKDEYGAYDSVGVMIVIENNSENPTDLTVDLMIKERDELISTFNTTLEPHEVIDTLIYWNTERTLWGTYTVLGEAEEGSRLRARDEDDFDIIPEISASISLFTNKSSYKSYENVEINSTAKNTSPNYFFDETLLEIAVISPDNDTLTKYSHSFGLSLDEVVNRKDFWNTEASLPGEYWIKGILFNNDDGSVLSDDSLSFTLSESVVLMGGINVIEESVQWGEYFDVARWVKNTGNIDINGYGITNVIDPVTKEEKDTVTTPLSIMMDSTYYDTLRMGSGKYYATKNYLVSFVIEAEGENTGVGIDNIIILDVISPLITEIISPDEDEYYSQNLAVRARVTDDVSGVKKVEYGIDALSYNEITRIEGDSLNGVYEGLWDSGNTEDGEYNLTVRAEDKAGNNWNTSSSDLNPVEVNFKVDNTKPVSQLSIHTPRYPLDASSSPLYITSQTPIEITAEDPIVNGVASGLDTVYYRINSGTWNVYIDIFNISTEGTNTVEYYSVDIAGNKEEVESKELIVDNTAPITALNIGIPRFPLTAEPLYVTSQTPLILETDEEGCGIDTTYYRIDSGTWSTYTGGEFDLADEGTHILEYYSVDNLGNREDIKSKELTVDDSSPISSLLFSEPKKMYNDTLYISPQTDISIEAFDTCGVAHSFYAVSSLTGDTVQSWIEVIGSFNIPYTPPYYRYIISYYSEDNLGNTESPKDTVVALDCEPPVTTLIPGSPSYQPSADSSQLYIISQTPLGFEVSDDISGVDSIYYQVDGAGWIANRYPPSADRIEFNIEDEGTHTVEYYSVDKAGNREDVNSKELRVDETHPLSQLVTGSPSYVLPGDSLGRVLISSNTPLILTGEDPISSEVASGVKELKYTVTKLSADSLQFTATTEGDSTMFTISGEDGSYRIDYRALDNVLNEEPFNSKYYDLDDTKPVAIIISPLDSTLVSDEITIIGTAKDKNFKEYILEYGEGIDPADWNTITISEEEVEDSILGKLDVSDISGNILTVRLRATDLGGNEAIDEVILWKGGLICEFDIPLHKPEGVDYDIQGNIYATDREGGKKLRCRDMVKKFDPFGNLIYEIPDRYVPNDVVVTPWNNILISEQVRKEITEFDQSQEYIRSIKKLKGPDGVDAMRLADSGTRLAGGVRGGKVLIGVADQTADKVILYDSLFNKITEINITDRKLRCYHHPEGISFDKEGNVYTCLINNNTVRKYDLDGNILMEITGFNKPSDVEVDYRGYIWVTDRNNDRIRCFDSYGNHLFKYGKKGKGCGEFNKPEGIAVNHERLYVADMNNDRVQVLRFPFSVRFPVLSSIGKTRQEALSIQECVPYPNPCDPDREFSNIRVVVSRDCEIEIRIYSLTGTLLWETAITGFAGINEVTWNGRNTDGEEVRNGVYNVLVRAKDGAEKDEERTKIIVYRR